MDHVTAVATMRKAREIEQAFWKADIGITAGQFDILDTLQAAKSAGLMTTMGSLTHERFCTPAVVTGAVDRLEKLRLVRRVHATGANDRRKTFVEVTDAGLAMLNMGRTVVEKMG